MKGFQQPKRTSKESKTQFDFEQLEKSIKDPADKMWKEGQTPKEALGMKSTQMEAMYAQAYRFYNTGKYRDAIHLFRVLIMYNSLEPKYMFGLAACHHMLKEYTDALQAYATCNILDPHNPIPHYHASDCYLQMKEYLSALFSLEMAIKTCGDKPQYAKMKERSLLSLDSLKKQAYSNRLEETPQSAKAIGENPLNLFFD